MPEQRTLLDGQTGAKFDSSELQTGQAITSNSSAAIVLDLNGQITLTPGSLTATEVLFNAAPIPVTLPGTVSGYLVEVGLQIQMSAAAAESDTLLTVAVNWGASPKETSQQIRFRWRTTVQPNYALVRLFAQSPAAAANLEVIFTADTVPATETFDILAPSTRFFITSMNGLVSQSE